jgi:hypothetical protein
MRGSLMMRMIVVMDRDLVENWWNEPSPVPEMLAFSLSALAKNEAGSPTQTHRRTSSLSRHRRVHSRESDRIRTKRGLRRQSSPSSLHHPEFTSPPRIHEHITS